MLLVRPFSTQQHSYTCVHDWSWAAESALRCDDDLAYITPLHVYFLVLKP